jgi:hypothetical protein
MHAIEEDTKPPVLEDINAVIDGETPLIVAARLNRLEVLTLLLKAPDIQVDLMDAKGWFDSQMKYCCQCTVCMYVCMYV